MYYILYTIYSTLYSILYTSAGLASVIAQPYPSRWEYYKIGFDILSTPRFEKRGWGRRNVETNLFSVALFSPNPTLQDGSIITKLLSTPPFEKRGWGRRNVETMRRNLDSKWLRTLFFASLFSLSLQILLFINSLFKPHFRIFRNHLYIDGCCS